MTNQLSRWLAAVFVATTALAALAVTPGVALASGGSITCTGTSEISYTPGITLLEQEVIMEQQDVFNLCVSQTSPGITAGSGAFVGPLDLSCLSPLPVDGASYTIYWNDNTSSTMELTYTMTFVAGQVVAVIAGSVTSGTFTGSTVVGSWTYVSLSMLDCLLHGITEQDGVIALTITGPA